LGDLIIIIIIIISISIIIIIIIIMRFLALIYPYFHGVAMSYAREVRGFPKRYNSSQSDTGCQIYTIRASLLTCSIRVVTFFKCCYSSLFIVVVVVVVPRNESVMTIEKTTLILYSYSLIVPHRLDYHLFYCL
jgi:hypothetical protein